jgi:hypothetical protein
MHENWNCEPKRAPKMTIDLDQYVRDVVAKAPPLSPEQRDKIAALLRPSATDAADVNAPIDLSDLEEVLAQHE